MSTFETKHLQFSRMVSMLEGRQAFEWSSFKLDTTDPRLPSTFLPQEIQKTYPPEYGLCPHFLQVCRPPWKMKAFGPENGQDARGQHPRYQWLRNQFGVRWKGLRFLPPFSQIPRLMR